MKAITLHQPWASLIAAGAKTIETRPRRTSYRGRIAIHAGQATPVDVMPWILRPDRKVMVDSRVPHVSPEIPLPLGAVVASAVLTDCVPIVDYRDIDHHNDLRDAQRQGRWLADGGGLVLWRSEGHVREELADYSDQRPFGDFRTGRWALLLDDIAPTTERCPACWGERSRGIVADCRVCHGTGYCDPIPARGQQAVPWEWTPQPAGERS